MQTWAQSYGVDTYLADGKRSDDPFYGSGHDFPVAMAKMPDGGFVVAGQLDLPELHYHAVPPSFGMAALVRYAADGSILWQKELSQTNNTVDDSGTAHYAASHVHAIATDASGNIFIAGGKGNTRNGGEQPFVAKFSPNGKLLWDNGFDSGSAEIGDPPQTVPIGAGGIYYMSLTKDGGVVVTFAQLRPNSAYTIPALAKFNADGSFAFSKAYDNTIQYLGSTPVCQSKDGSRYVMAFVYATDGSALGSRYGLVLVMTDATGKIVAQRGYNHSDAPNEIPVAITATADGGFAVLSGPYTEGYFAILRKFNSDLSSEVFKKRIDVTPGQQYGYFAANSLVETADGGFLLGGSAQPQDGSSISDVMLMKLNSGGALQFVSLLGGPKNEGYPISWSPMTSFAIETADGGYGLAAASTSYHVGSGVSNGAYDIPDWWVAKTDANRKVNAFEGTMENQPQSTYTVTHQSEVGAKVSVFYPPNYPYGLGTSSQPAFVLEDLGAKMAPNQPVVMFQGSSPRIMSAREAEAVVGQHFAYHTVPGFFPAGANLTFSATNLPKGFVIDPNTGVISGVAPKGSQTTDPIIVHLHVTDGEDAADATLALTIGIGAPTLTVNGSNEPHFPPATTAVTGFADTPLEFAVDYPGELAGLNVTIEATTTPADETSWKPLDTALDGKTTYDRSTDRYVLNTTNYPRGAKVYFRARAKADGFTPQLSNVVGPFDLASTKPRLAATSLSMTGNGSVADLYFSASEPQVVSGTAMRIQTSTTPSIEGSWTDLANGNAGAMGRSTNKKYPNVFLLAVNNFPTRAGVYFRAVAAADGYVDSISNMTGPFDITATTAPVVNVQVVAGTNLANSGNGNSPDTVINLAAGQISITATANSDRPLTSLDLLIDGKKVARAENGGKTVDYTSSALVVGDHILSARAVNDLGATARGVVGATYIRVKQGPTAANTMRASGDTSGSAAAVTGKTYTAVQSFGFWNNASMWKDENGKNGVPGPNDFAIIGSNRVSFAGGEVIKVGSVSLNGGILDGVGSPNNLEVLNQMTIYAGKVQGPVFIFIDKGATLQFVNSKDVVFAPKADGVGAVYNSGEMNVQGAAGVTGLDLIDNRAEIFFQQPVTIPVDGLLDPAAATRLLQTKALTGSGSVGGEQAALIGNDGASLITNDGGSLISNDGGSIVKNADPLITNDGGSLITNDGGSLTGNKIDVQASGHALSSQASAAATVSGFSMTGGEFNLSACDLQGAVTLSRGVITGSGIINGDVTNSGGFIAPGHSPGGITVTGNYTQGANGTMVLEAAGAEPGQFDRVQVGGTAKLDGTLEMRTIGGYKPLPNDPLNPIGYGAVSGSFAAVSGNLQLKLKPDGILATLIPNAPNPPAPKLLNISTRLRVEAGDNNALIAGFYVSGTSSKKVLIRALGPSLSQRGIADPLDDPTLELDANDAAKRKFNDDWQSGTPNQIPQGFAPSDPRESVIVATVTPGFHTAIVSGKDGHAGVAIVEAYDLEGSAPEELANISTRGLVQTGENVMIGGFFVGGNAPAKVLLRAIGPSLTQQNVAGALADPELQLTDANGSTITNDDWAAVAADLPNGFAPSDQRESALVATLVPGAYTAIVSGKSGTTGVALIEAYNLE